MYPSTLGTAAAATLPSKIPDVFADACLPSANLPSRLLSIALPLQVCIQSCALLRVITSVLLAECIRKVPHIDFALTLVWNATCPQAEDMQPSWQVSQSSDVGLSFQSPSPHCRFRILQANRPYVQASQACILPNNFRAS